MKRLFGHKPKTGGKTSRDFNEEGPKTPPIPTPLYQKLATAGGPISQPTFQQSTQQIPSPSDEQWASTQQSHQEQPGHLPNPHSPPISAPTRSNSYNAIPHGPVTPIPGPNPPRSASPMSTHTNMSNGANKLVRHHDPERKKPPPATVALGILNALEPPRTDGALSHTHSGRVYSEDRERHTPTPTPQHLTISESGHGYQVAVEKEKEKEKKRGFWGSKDKEKEREKDQREREREWQRDMQLRKERHERDQRDRGREGVRKDDESQAELTRMIGYLTATASEDWALVLEVCERASASENTAKEAVRALRREFKYGEPAAQLSAARLWAIMLRNSSEVFISQSTSRKFLDTLEDLLSSSRTSPVVRERLLEVVAAAAYASGTKKDGRHDRDGFKGLWKRVKPFDKPEEGVPFDTDDAMFQPPQSGRLSAHDVPILSYQEASPLPVDSAPVTPTPNTIKKRKSPTRNRIIPPDEDMRRLFQECKIGQGNAAVLSDALVRARPEDLRKVDVIKEFYAKCRASQELIYAQIPWATSIAERSRLNKQQDEIEHVRKRTASNDIHLGVKDTPDSPIELTIEEKLLAALLAANAELLEALTQWDDLNRIAIEKKVEDRSRKEIRMEQRNRDYESSLSTTDGGGAVSRTPSPPSRSHSPLPQQPGPPSSYSDHRPHHHHQLSLAESDSDPSLHGQQNLAPPPAAPHGPRSPSAPYSATGHSRTPSPTRIEPYLNGRGGDAHHLRSNEDSDSSSDLDGDEKPPKPSAKALGKRKVIDTDAASERNFDPDDIYYHNNGQAFHSNEGLDPDFEEENDSRWRHPPTNFVYDAVAERTRQLLSDSNEPRVNSVH